jgi:transposase
MSEGTSKMFTARDNLFLERMDHFISLFESTELRKNKVFIRHSTRKISNRVVIEYVFICLSTGLPWEKLQLVIKENIHYQTIYKRFESMSKHGALKYAWTKITENYVHSRLSKNAFHFKNLYIDTTTIKNVAGTDCTGRNPTDRGRQGSKISVIIDEFKVSVSEPTAFPANVHDSRTVEDTLANIPFDLTPDGRTVTRVGADKAYTSKKLFNKLIAQKIRIVSEPKKNAKNPVPIRNVDKAMFKKRTNIEHFFGIMKRLRRLRCRYDVHIDHYNAFWYIGMARRALFALSNEVSNIDLQDVTLIPISTRLS